MKKKAPSSQPKTETPTTENHDVIDRLKNFHILQNPRVRAIFGWIPALLVLLVFVDWLLGVGAFSGDTFRMTGVLMVALVLLAIRILFDQLPKALATVWRRGLIDVSPNDGGSRRFVEYIDQFERALNSNYQIGPALLFAAGSLLATFPFRYWMLGGRFPTDLPGMLIYYFGAKAGIIAPILGLVVGALAWRVGVIAYFIGRLGDRFSLKIQINHSDQSGGLKPLGDLAFNIALVLLFPAIFLAIWGFVTIISDDPSLQDFMVLWGGMFRQLLVLLGVSSIFAFIQPVYKIHLRMEDYAQKIRAELDNLSLRIETLSHELRSEVDEIDPQLGEEKLRTIGFMKKVYDENSRVPTWPFNWNTIIRFASAQAIPFLSLIGTSGPVVEMVRGLFSLAN